MKVNCEIIRDLLPLYVDEICSKASSEMVEEHLQECSACTDVLATMHAKEEPEKEVMKEKKFADGLKKLKNRNHKRVILAAVSAAAALILAFVGAESLFVLPLKDLKPEDIRISAEVYTADELPVVDVEDKDVSISLRVSGEEGSKLVAVQIPPAPNVLVSMTQSVLDEKGAVTLVKWESDYHIRRMRWRYSNVDAGVVYLDSIRTSFFNNKANEEIKSTISLEAGAIHKIIYVDKDGRETVLWEQAEDVSTDASQQITP